MEDTEMKVDGPKVRRRYQYASVQSALRRYAAMGITLEVDADGVPVVPINRVVRYRRSDMKIPESLPSSMPTAVLHDTRDLGNYTRQWRERCAVTLQKVSKDARLGIRFFSEFERGKPTVQLGKVITALDVLGLEILIRPRR